MPAFRDTEAIFFDLDNTLYDMQRDTERVVHHVHEAFPGVVAGVSPEAFQKAYDHALFTLLQDPARRPKAGNHLDWRTHVYAELLPHLDLDAASAPELAREHMRFRFATMEALPGALANVQDLQAERTVGLITNGPGEIQRAKIEALGLHRILPADLILVAGELDVWKPDAAIFREATDRAGVDPKRACMVGDSLIHDVPAKLQGWRAVWFHGVVGRDGGSEDADVPPDAEARTHAEVRRLFV